MTWMTEDRQAGRSYIYIYRIWIYIYIKEEEASSRIPGGSCPGSRVRIRAGGSRSHRTRPRDSACPATAGWPSPAAATAWSPPGRR